MEREQILSQLRERIAAFAASRIESGAAEDLAQETMLLLHQKYGRLEAMDDLLPLAFRIMRFKLAAHVRKRNRRGEDRAADVSQMPVSDPGPEEALLAAEARAALLEALAALGERCRELLRLKLAGRGFEEIRRHFGAASINTVYTWDSRCREQLKQSLRRLWGTEA